MAKSLGLQFGKEGSEIGIWRGLQILQGLGFGDER